MQSPSENLTDPFADTCYRHNFLKEVIVRVDLLNPLAGIDSALPPKLTEVALRAFPIAEPRELLQQKLEFAPTNLVRTEERFKEWNFHGRDRTKKLTMSRQVVLVQHTRYETYELIRDEFIQILERLVETFDSVQPSRVGLRYVNVIDRIDDLGPLDWSPYIDSRLLSLFSFPFETDRTAVSRVFHNLELSFDSFNFRYRLGMHNPDYPAAIRQKIFTLDLDTYTESFVEPMQIGRLLDRFHAIIQQYFEASITDELRNLMNNA